MVYSYIRRMLMLELTLMFSLSIEFLLITYSLVVSLVTKSQTTTKLARLYKSMGNILVALFVVLSFNGPF